MVRFIISIFVLSLIFGCNNSKEDPRLDNNIFINDFELKFIVDKEIIIEGDSNNPIYSIKSIAILDSLLFIADDINNKIYKFDLNGNLKESWGREGRGPLEFLNISEIGKFDDETIYVLDSGGNNRVHLIDTQGNVKKIFPLASVGPFRDAYFKFNENDTLLYVNTILPCNNDIRVSCVNLIQDLNGNKVKAIGRADEIWPNHTSLPFLSVFTGKTYYSINTFGSRILMYNEGGKTVDNIEIPDFNGISFIDESTLPNNVFEQVLELNRRSFTAVDNMKLYNDYLFVEFIKRGPEYTDSKHNRFLKVFNSNNEHIYTGFESNYKLMKSYADGIIFLNQNEISEYGQFYIKKIKQNETN